MDSLRFVASMGLNFQELRLFTAELQIAASITLLHHTSLVVLLITPQLISGCLGNNV
jgi:hypothetical protein